MPRVSVWIPDDQWKYLERMVCKIEKMYHDQGIDVSRSSILCGMMQYGAGQYAEETTHSFQEGHGVDDRVHRPDSPDQDRDGGAD